MPVKYVGIADGIAPPEMIFGGNSVLVQHEKSGWGVKFDAYDALDVVDKTGDAGILKVAYAEHWQRMREKVSEDIRDVVKPFDWTYSTDWKGKITEGDAKGMVENDSTVIPVDKLRRPDPILLFDDVMLYEDELADNGIAVLSVKIRVMEERLLILQRFFLRLDNVIIRLRDTRVYIEFATGQVIREYTSREASYDDVKKGLTAYHQDDIPGLMRDPNKLAELVPIIEILKETTTTTQNP